MSAGGDPAGPERVPPDHGRPPATGSVPDHRPHALVVEDEPDVLDLLEGYLNTIGYRVDRAASGEHGTALALADPPDLAIVDFRLPGIDGREVIRRLRDEPRTAHCRIIAISILDRPDLDAMPVDAVLTKPFRRANVVDLVQALMRADPMGER